MSAQAYGRQFESEIHAFLTKTKPDFLLNETEIRKHYPAITAIDHLLISNDICYCFQDKWLSSNISNSNFNHFSKCVEEVAKLINKYIYAVYISNVDFSSIADIQFNNENSKPNRQIEYVKINDSNKKNIFKKLQYFLHSNNVFVYDDEGDTVML